MSMPWFRFYAEFAGNPIVQSLAFEDQRHFVILLCLKCDGALDRPIAPKVRERIICRGLGLDPMTASEVKRRLGEVGLIADDWQPTGWKSRQFASDNSTERVAKHRKNKKTGNVPSPLQERFGNGPDTDTDTDTETEEKTPPIAPLEISPSDAQTFDAFWDAYPLKKAKQAAAKVWANLSPAKRAAAMADIPRRLALDRQWIDGYIPHATTYLNGERWTDEIEKRHEANPRPDRKPRTAAERGEAFGAECWGRIDAQRRNGSDVD